MRPLTTSLTPAELADLLDVSPELVDALLDSGRVLCHVRRGEPRIPLEQLEAFFRESLIRIYQAEASANGAVSAPVAELPHLAEPETEPEPMFEEEPEAALEAAAAAPAPPPAIIATPAPPARPAGGDDEEDDRHDQRIATRYVPLRQLGGIFGDTKFTLLQVSASGLRIRHNEPLLPGQEGKLSFALLRPARSVVIRARVVWTSIARSGNDRFSISGLRVIEHSDRLAAAIESLKSTHELQPERRARIRRAGDALATLTNVSDEEMTMVTAAIQKFADDPIEASRWYSRARFALADENVRRVAPARARDREEVLGIWEYLDRQVDISKIAGVVSWMKAG